MYEPPKDLKFLTPARSKLIEMLLRRSGITLPPAQTIARRNPSATCSLSYAQRRLWDASKRKTGEQNDVVYATAQLSGELNTRALHQALNEIIRRHDL